METQTTERRSSLNLYRVQTTAEIIYDPELYKQKDMISYYESFEEIMIKKGGLILSIIISNLPEEEKNKLKSLMDNTADLVSRK